MVKEIRYQLARVLHQSHVMTANIGSQEYLVLNTNSLDNDIITAILYAGMYRIITACFEILGLGTCVRIDQQKKHPHIYLPNGGKARIHPSSACYSLQKQVRPFRYPFLAYWSVQETSRVFVKDVSELSPLAVLSLGPLFRTIHAPTIAARDNDMFMGDVMGLESAQYKGRSASRKENRNRSSACEAAVGLLDLNKARGRQKGGHFETGVNWWLCFNMDTDMYELVTLMRDWMSLLVDLFFCEKLLPAPVSTSQKDLESDAGPSTSLVEEFDRQRRKSDEKRIKKELMASPRGLKIGPIAEDDRSDTSPSGAKYHKKYAPTSLWQALAQVLSDAFSRKISCDMHRDKYAHKNDRVGLPLSAESRDGKKHKRKKKSDTGLQGLPEDVQRAMTQMVQREARKSRNKGKGKNKPKDRLRL